MLNCSLRFLAALLLSTLSGTLQAAERPNVLLILVDDLKPALGCYGDPIAKTPHIDNLAARGMRFDRAYCNQAVCAPSRFTLMLGSHSTSTGLYGLGSELRQILPDAITMPQHFAKHGGYRTESLGKVFHIGHGNNGDPESFQVPHFHDKVIEYLDPASTGGQLTREEAYFTNQKLNAIRSLPRGAAFESPRVEDTEYADGRVAAETIRRLRAARERRQNDGTPFFITAGFARPHLPFSAPQKYWDLYDPASLPMPERETLPDEAPPVAGKRGGEITNYKPVPTEPDAEFSEDLKRQLIHGYYASTSFVDAQIGKVLDELEQLGLAENTIVVLWGDHGFHLGDLGIWTKHTNYEQANRIPILIAAPGITKPGTSTHQPAESVDIFPTLAQLAGLPAPEGPQPIDGVSLVPVLNNPSTRVRDHAYHAYPKKKLGRAIRTERYRLVEWQAFNDGEESAEYELYDYETDPLETLNLAPSQPKVVSKLKQILDRYPEPVDRDRRRADEKTSHPPNAENVSIKTPEIALRPLSIQGRVEAVQGDGVIVAQGGREHGYAVHILKGRLTFDVRVNGNVTRVSASDPTPKKFDFKAVLTEEKITLIQKGKTVATGDSPGFIPVQPKDGLNVGHDELSAAGDYEAPNPLNGRVVELSVTSSTPNVVRMAPKDEDDATQFPKLAFEQVATDRKPRPVMDAATIHKGLKSHDRALYLKAGWIRDPYITLGPDDRYYLTGTQPREGDARADENPYNIGLGDESIVGDQVRVWRSDDLVNWEDLGPIFTVADTWKSRHEGKNPRRLIWAPELHWLGDRWALVHCPKTHSSLATTEGRELAGPWTHPMKGDLGPRHDPSLFTDDNGTRYLLWGNTLVAPLSEDLTSYTAEPVRIDPAGFRSGPDGTPINRIGHEGATMIKVGGKYVHMGTAWSTDEGRKGSYNLYYCVADQITGPYGPRKFAGRFLGHGTPFTDKDGQWWCTAFFNANVPPLSRKGIANRDLSENAQTINEQGVTIVPLDVRLLDDGEVFIRAKDPAYANPGPDEAQQFPAVAADR
ncbi:sulfatase-like hydrolase/transferase [Rubinisphaera margarita]|uniref:sulfatase-like hydrolase/transferase n=1 Tax=Rubinisphaera margarita TaxID=2909586 RepID=UPI001EE959B3|nr:sulfatase-like hydrolase/transferase [Rubinisphaera margarita]MCG6155295.1 sulfatase-like hydrolase/transferase [Rubinisphaera margarita]